MKSRLVKDFYQIQRLQARKSLLLLLLLVVFYFIAIMLICSVFILLFGLILAGERFLSGGLFLKITLIISVISLVAAILHFFEARKFGAAFIRKRLQARPPDPSDRYHKQFINTVDEIRIASGMPPVKPFILPSFAINSMALIEPDSTPNVLVTEGLLADFTRDEIQAVVAHELAHVSRGDTYYITLVCSLANFFERLRDAMEPEDEVSWGPEKAQSRGVAPWFVSLGVTISSILMHLLSTLISRQREILADAAAVEFSRNPRALARAIYKAHLKNSFVGDFNLTYMPLFIVPPESRGEEDNWLDRLFNSHPPLMDRIQLLAESTRIKPSQVIEEVWEIQKNREKVRTILASSEDRNADGSATDLPEKDAPLREGKPWLIWTPKGQWQGPYSLEELIFQRGFSPLIRVRNDPESVEAQAREFPQIRNALRNLGRKKPVDSTKHNRCPHCRISLHDDYYEGVEVKICPRCRGKLVDFSLMERIIARKEVGFSDNLIKKAEEFRERFMQSPILTKKIIADKPQPIFCPNCGSRMLPRPYSYHYVVPVDKCLSCYKIWFDADELEILQILIERR